MSQSLAIIAAANAFTTAQAALNLLSNVEEIESVSSLGMFSLSHVSAPMLGGKVLVHISLPDYCDSGRVEPTVSVLTRFEGMGVQLIPLDLKMTFPSHWREQMTRRVLLDNLENTHAEYFLLALQQELSSLEILSGESYVLYVV